MTALMKTALRRLQALPEQQQDRVARQVLGLPELSPSGQEVEGASSIVSILQEPVGTTRSKNAIDRDLETMRADWHEASS